MTPSENLEILRACEGNLPPRQSILQETITAQLRARELRQDPQVVHQVPLDNRRKKPEALKSPRETLRTWLTVLQVLCLKLRGDCRDVLMPRTMAEALRARMGLL